jgi:trigger factor
MAEPKDAQEQTPQDEQQAPNKVTIEEIGPCKKKLSIEVPEETIKKMLDEQFKDLRKDAVLPGFRRGRAPMRLVEKRYGSDIRGQVKLKILADASQKAIDDNKIDMLGDPDIDYEKVELPESGPMTFGFEVEVRPQFELPELEGIAIEKPKVEITDAKIDEEILDFRKHAGLWTLKDGGVESGDQAVVDVVIKIEGGEDEKRDNIEVFARPRGFVGSIPVDKLDELLAGAKAGDKRQTTVEVAETFFMEQYRGKKVTLDISIKEVKRIEPAEMTEEFFTRHGVKDIDELRNAMKQYHSSQAEQEARRAMGEQIHDYLLEHTQIDLPADIVAAQSTGILQRRYSSMLMQGTPKEQIDQQMEDLRASSEEQAVEQLKLLFVMDKIAEKLKIEVTDEEVNGQIAQIAVSRGRRPEKMREELAKDGSLTQFMLQIREQKCIEKLLETAKIEEVEPSKVRKIRSKPAAKTAKAAKPATKAKAKDEDAEKDDDKAEKKASREDTASKRSRKSDDKKADKKEK